MNEKRGVLPDTALRLARFFGGDAQSWLNLQQVYDLELAEKAAVKTITRQIHPLRNDERFALAA